MIKEIKGDLLDTDCRIIAHGVNCQGVMGSGVARALYEKWPVVRNQYLDFFTENNAGPDGENFLGDIDPIVMHPRGAIIVNCFTQQFYGGDNWRYVNYEAVYTCMELLYDLCLQYKENEVAIPKIGCGLANGDWRIVKAILESVFPPDFTVKVYSL